MDEADLYKNLAYVTKMNRIAGLPNSDSNRAFDMFLKVRYLQERNEGRGVVFVERCSFESAAPSVTDPDRVADPSTLRRWFRSLDSSQPSFSFLRNTLTAATRLLARGETIRHDALTLSWPNMALFLQLLWPLRL